MKRLRIVLAVFVSTIAGIQLLPFILWAPMKLAEHGYLLDDAFFYSVLGKNYWEYGFLTLDGIMPTNGIQPLWMIIQIILGRLFPDVNNVILLSRSSWILYILFILITIWFVTKNPVRKENLLSVGLISGILLLNPQFQTLVVQGLETSLTLFVLVLNLYFLDTLKTTNNSRFQSIDYKEIIILGLLNSTLFFSRTDLFWICVVIGIWLISIEKSVSKKVMLYFSTVFILISPYLMFNFFTQKNLLPISGRVKLFYMNMFLPTIREYILSNEWKGLFNAFAEVFYLPKNIFISIIVSTSLIIFGLVFVLRKRMVKDYPLSIRLFSFVIICHILFMYIVYRELRPYSRYYFSIEILWVVLVGVYEVAKIDKINDRVKKLNKIYKSSNYLLYLILGVFFLLNLINSGWIGNNVYATQRINIAKDINALVPENMAVGAFWPGNFAQFSQRKIIPLDGIIGSNEYFENYLKSGKEIEYLLDNSVKYIVIYLPISPDLLFLDSQPKIPNWAQLGTLRLWEIRKSIEIISSRTWGEQNTGWYLFKLKDNLWEINNWDF